MKRCCVFGLVLTLLISFMLVPCDYAKATGWQSNYELANFHLEFSHIYESGWSTYNYYNVFVNDINTGLFNNQTGSIFTSDNLRTGLTGRFVGLSCNALYAGQRYFAGSPYNASFQVGVCEDGFFATSNAGSISEMQNMANTYFDSSCIRSVQVVRVGGGHVRYGVLFNDVNGDGKYDLIFKPSYAAINIINPSISSSQDGYALIMENMPKTVGDGSTPAGAIVGEATAAKIAAQGAQSAANSAASNASSANTNAYNAYLDSNYIRNSMLSVSAGIIQDSSGTVLAEARAAKNNTSIANNMLSDNTYGLQAITNKLNNVTTSVVNNSQDIKNSIINMNSKIKPIIGRIYGEYGATCTTTSQFKVRVSVSNATQFRVKPDTGNWSTWEDVGTHAIVNGIIGNGVHVIEVEVKDNEGNIVKDAITVYKL